jgi:putative addiction module killer protein
VDALGRNPFERWFSRLDETASARVLFALRRLRDGGASDVKGVGSGVLELRLHFGPGYRIYFGRDGLHLILLLAGGTKARQGQDIADAQARWAEYKQSKKMGKQDANETI